MLFASHPIRERDNSHNKNSLTIIENINPCRTSVFIIINKV